MKTFNTAILIALLSLFVGCKKDHKPEAEQQQQETLFTLLSPKETGVEFVNEIKNGKELNIFKYRNFYNGGGVAIGDINNDGLPDVYLTANMKPNKLYLNKGNLQFEDITEQAGVGGTKPWSTGVTMADINGDGLLDIYVSNAGNLEGNNHDNDLYINQGNLTFTEEAKRYNLAETGFSTHASFFDYDLDGDLDAYILNNSNIPVSSLGYAEQREVRAQDWEGVPHIFKGVGDMLLRNDDGKFVDVSQEAGIYGSLIGFGLGVLVTDLNHDLYPDIYVSNDFYERDYLYINQKDGTFSEEIKNWTSHLSLSAMGIDIGDINNDGQNDIFITDMLPEPEQRVKSVMEFEGYNVFKLKQSKDFYQQYIQNTLQLNNGDGTFSEVAYYSGIDATDWSWAGLMFDMDNDGFKDIFVTNGINHDLTDLDFVDFFANEIIQRMVLEGKKESIDTIIERMPIKPQPNYAFRNNGDITFSNANKDWGFEKKTMSNGAAYADLDNDGDLDLVINNVNAETYVYRNNSEKTGNNSLRLSLNGYGKNPFAVGSTAIFYFDGQQVRQELIPSRGFQSSVDYTLHLGLGQTQRVDSIRIIFPDQRTRLLTDVEAGQHLQVNYDSGLPLYSPVTAKSEDPWLREIANDRLRPHQENEFNDFDHEGLIYSKLSQEGPALAVADVDGDGHEDLYLGGARGQAGTILINRGKGNLRPFPQSAFDKDKVFEDTAAAFFDADGDGDADLMVGSGGNEAELSRTYRPRLYLNDGFGRFSPAEQELPSTFHNASVVAPTDFDQDGDMDVFIGSRSVPGVYGVSPDHLLLENQGDGTFTNSTERRGYYLRDAGMITDAVWMDMDGDQREDLLTVSEWGTPRWYRNNGRRLNPVEGMLDSLPGWWNTIEATDMDGDGDMDLILGNQGENLHYRPSEELPMRMYVHDFDNNGTIEQVVTIRKDGRDYPIHQKSELTAQLVSLKKQNLKASEYAAKSIDELFPEEITDQALVREVRYSASVVLYNEGEGQFRIEKLPPRVQLSCVCDIVCEDIDLDGNPDLVLAGNNFEFKPQFSRLDAAFGHVLLGDGKGSFEWQNSKRSGLRLREEVKYMKVFRDRTGEKYIFAAVNDEKPRVYALD